MSVAPSRPARSALTWPALLATVLLLIFLLGGYTLIESRRLQQGLGRELEDRAVALIGILEASSKNAIASQSLLEEVVAQRLLDNARFVDFIVARTPQAQELIARVVQENKLAKVELLDRAGQPITLPSVEAMSPGPWGGGRGLGGPGRRRAGAAGESAESPGDVPGDRLPPPMMRGMMRSPEGWPGPGPETPGRPGMPFMWGHRWGGLRGDPTQLFPSLPKHATIRRFWEGSAFGVAVPAQSFPGVIVVHADAEYLLNFRREIGLQRLIEDLGRQTAVAEVTLLDRDLTVLASSDATTIGRQETDPFLREVSRFGTTKGRRQVPGAGREIYEVVKPFTLEAKRVGLIRLALTTEGLADVARQAQQGILWYSLGLLVVGILGTVAIFTVQARHLRERRALEEVIVREKRLSALGNLAAGVAHEIRNPLNAISIGLQRLRLEFAPQDGKQREEHARLARIIEAEVGRLNTIVQRFLTLARPLKLTLVEEPFQALLSELVTLLAPQATAHGIRTVLDLQVEGLRVRMDRSQLAHAFMNVLLNAIQAMPQGGTLTVRARLADATIGKRGNPDFPIAQSPSRLASRPHGPAAGQVVEVIVTDSGPGIPAEHLDRLFEPYFTTKPDGTGLGLPLTHKILEEHRGGIRAENGAGGGATFVITLPVAGSSA